MLGPPVIASIHFIGIKTTKTIGPCQRCQLNRVGRTERMRQMVVGVVCRRGVRFDAVSGTGR